MAAENETERAKLVDQFVLSVPSLVKLTQDGGYHQRVESAYNEIKSMKLATKV